MTQTLLKIVANFETSLVSKLEAAGSTFDLVSNLDQDGNALAAGTYGFTINEGQTNEEHVVGTLSGSTVTVTARNVQRNDSTTAQTGKTHRRGDSVKITNFPAIQRIYNILAGITGIDVSSPLFMDGTFTPTDPDHLATKSYVDAVGTGSATANALIVAGTAGATVALGDVVYLDIADGEWKLADADTAAQVDNIILGIAMGAGVDAGTIAGGVCLYGVVTGLTGLSVGKIYASNTAGGIASSAGTTEVTLGYAYSTTALYFDPRYDQLITGNQQDLIQQIEAGTDFYGASTVGTDAYAITPTPAITAYAAGMKFRFKTDVANAGACTLDVNGVGAKAIKKLNDQDLATGDIEASQIVEVVYDGTNFQMTSQPAQAEPAISTLTALTAGEAIDASSVSKAVYIKASDGKVYLLDSDADESAFKFMGIVAGGQNVAADASVNVTTGGIATGFSGLTVGDRLYPSATAGTLGTTPVSNQAQEVGLVISASSVYIIPNAVRAYSGSDVLSSGTGNTTSAITIGFRPRVIYFQVDAADGNEEARSWGMWCDGVYMTSQALGAAIVTMQASSVMTNVFTDGQMGITFTSIVGTGFTISYTRDGTASSEATVYFTVLG